jgi:hypothetical protein
MYPETQIPNGGLTLLGAIALSLLTPGWVAAFLGFGEAHAALLAWITGHEGVPCIVLWLCYGVFGFAMLVGIAIGAYAACIALMRGLARVKAWGVQAGQAIAGLLGELLYWPVQLASERVLDELQERRDRLYAFLREQHELRRMYAEEYAGDYPSFRAFQRAYDAHRRGQQASATDPLRQAIKLLGLPQRFTKDDVKRRFNLLIALIHPDKVGPNGEKIGPNELATQLIDAYKLICSRRAWQ